MYSIERANKYIQANKHHVTATYQPKLHFIPEIGWMNDPNGFVYYKGEYHLFYQYNPYDSKWDTMHWGHAKSKDLAHWEYLPIALAPDQDYDKNGCFSGSALVIDDTLWLMYTGHIVNEDGSISQVQNMAYSTDGITFHKIKENPVITGQQLPNEISRSDFRDPKLFEKDGKYYAVVATQHLDQVGCVVLIESENLLDWSFKSIFLKGEQNQGIVWECPDYFEIDGQSYLIVSPMQYHSEYLDFNNQNSNIIMQGRVDWQVGKFYPSNLKEIDHGHDFYAAQTPKNANNERVMIAWMHTWGRPLITDQLQHGWFGSMSLPRILTVQENQIIQKLPESLDNQFVKIELNEELKQPSKIEIDIKETIELRLGTKEDYISFGYDAFRKEVYIDRKNLKYQLIGEERNPVLYRGVQIQATHLTAYIDQQSIEIFVNDGQEVLTSVFYIEGTKKVYSQI